MRILVVEDDNTLRAELCTMYKNILGVERSVIDSASNGPDALVMIGNRRYDLMSLDINLYEGHPKTEDGEVDRTRQGIDGRTVLRKASEDKRCNGVVVITGLHSDEKLSVAIPDEDEIKQIRCSLHSYLEKLFPGKNLYLQKNPKSGVKDLIKIFGNVLTYQKLRELSEDPNKNKFQKKGSLWEITFNGKRSIFSENKGFTYIYHLILKKGGEIHVQDLLNITASNSVAPDETYSEMGREALRNENLSSLNLSDSGASKIPSIKGLTDLENKLKRINEDLQEAKNDKDWEKVEELEEKYEQLEFSTIKLYKEKRFDPNKRIRDAVTKAIKRSLKKMKESHQELRDHFASSIKTGANIHYRPAEQIEWELN